ncbi:hypothetical protein RCL_jg10071.t1 [Rhizophagus clarus]|uniref:Uncharacterized protein n=1 Tax=Rhizophagus clarus TaxID=94130 RepID=A0A8H3QD12_9GLOM|nr:hypothetical protein RCL_jg10071.t1 [Rhizophagus clarus]
MRFSEYDLYGMKFIPLFSSETHKIQDDKNFVHYSKNILGRLLTYSTRNQTVEYEYIHAASNGMNKKIRMRPIVTKKVEGWSVIHSGKLRILFSLE